MEMRVLFHNCFEPILWHAKAFESLLYVDLVKHIRALGRFKNLASGGRQVVIQAKDLLQRSLTHHMHCIQSS